MACMRDGFDQGKLLDGRFLTVSPLNHGSFGMVFTAKDIETGSDVAIKCITKPDAVKDNTHCPAAIGIDDRSEELEIHSRLPAHPNIVNLICNFETLHHQYMVLELCSNGDLYEAIRVGRGPLETEHVRDLMLELVDAIDHLHSHGVYHRDIKPENIFLTANGSMKLGDFGLATSETWSTEFAVGSDRYMAPEQFDSSVYGYGYSPASADVWAIGIVLLNVLFQRNPFATPTPKDPLFADFVHDRQSLFDVFPNMSQDTYNVLVHSLALDPANRSLGAVREAIKAVVSFTVDDEAIDEFCTESVDLMPVATAAREPLRTPSITSPNMSNGEAFPWATALLQTPQKPARQLSTIPDNEPDLFPGSYVSEKLFGDADEASLSSQVDSGLGMSYKSAKSVKSLAPKKVVIGSLPINFSRPTKTSPYGATGSGFSKSWSDLYDEEEELELELEQETPVAADMERVDTVKPSTPQLTSAADDDRGSATPRPINAVPAIPPHVEDMRTASPLRRMVEEDKANPESTRQRTASVMDRWAALGIRRRAKAEAAAPALTTSVTTAIPAPPPIPKSKYSDAFASFSPFTSSKKQKSRPKTSHDDSTSWRQGSPQRLRSTSFNRSRVWERKEQSPSQEKWSLDNNWRQHMSPAAAKTSPPLQKSPSRPTKTEKSFLDLEFDDGIGDLQFGLDMAGNDDVEWKGSGWQHDFL